MVIGGESTKKAETIPQFGGDFARFMEFLSSDTMPASISPKRFGQMLGIDMQTLALHAQVHRNTIRRAPDSDSLQSHLRESVRVIRAAVAHSGSVENAIFWFRNHPVASFEFKTPQAIVSEKRTEALIQYIISLQAGFSG